MSPTDQLLLLLHSAAWAEHKIGSAYEAAFDMIANNTAKSDISIDALSQSWHVHRNTAHRYLNEARRLVIDSMQEVLPNAENDRQDDAHVEVHDAHVGVHNPSRVNEDNNINAFSKEKASVSVKRVRERFVRPSPEEVNDYLRQIGETRFTGQEFYNYYESVGWVVGRDHKQMKCWKAAIRTWQHYRKTTSKTDNTSSHTPHHYDTSTTPHRYPSDRAAERAERQQQFAQHIQRLLDDPGAEQQPTLDF